MTALLALTLAACGGNAATDRNMETEQEEATPTPEPTKASDKKPTPEATPTPEEEPVKEDKVDYLELYAPVLMENLEVIQNGIDSERRYLYLSTGVMERIMYAESGNLLDSIGYAITDINSDGIPDLLIGENRSLSQSGEESEYIYELRSYSEGKTVHVFEGWGRNTFRCLKDGSFLNEGSNGASSSSFGQCRLSEDGTGRVWIDFYFTAEENGAMAFYHNQSGEWNPDKSEKLDISAADFWKVCQEYETQTLDLTPMRDFAEASVFIDPIFLMPEEDRAILGSWTLRSYVNMDVIGLKLFPDGTWLAIENPSLQSDKCLAGNWQATAGGVDYYGYDIYYEDGSEKDYAMVGVNEMGEKTLSIGRMEYYFSDYAADEEAVSGSWLFPRGDSIVFGGDGEWDYYDDENNWVLGGHSVIESGPNGIYLRLHTQAGDTGLTIFGRGIYHSDATGTDVIDMDFDPMFKDFVGEAATLSRGL